MNFFTIKKLTIKIGIKLPCQFPLVKLGKDLVVELLVNIVDGTRLVRLVPQGVLEKLKGYKGKVAFCAHKPATLQMFSPHINRLRDLDPDIQLKPCKGRHSS